MTTTRDERRALAEDVLKRIFEEIGIDEGEDDDANEGRDEQEKERIGH